MSVRRNGLPFDLVVVVRNGQKEIYSPAQFVALPLPERIGLVLARQVTFLRDGDPVDVKLALKSLMDAAQKRG